MILALVLAAQTPLLTRAHSHNDYMRARPLDEALENGFNSVEVDVFPVDGKLLVSHNEKDIKPDKTIESMYLDKLSARAKANKGAIYPGAKATFWVLVDVKKKGIEAYQSFKTILDRYPELKPEKSRVKFVISGDRAKDAIAADKGKWAGIDGRVEDLGKGYSVAQMPWISGDFSVMYPVFMTEAKYFNTNLSPPNVLVKKVHAEHRLMRFWGASDNEEYWKDLWGYGVDLINTDRPADLRKWMLKQK